jgi:uncharacterized damage-inducible protein DinB
MKLLSHLRTQARANRLANHRLHRAMAALTDADLLERTVEMPRARHVQREPLANVVAHLLNHQVHHRGQAHAMLAGAAVKPPQLDEFLMSSEGHLRGADLAAPGWTEADLFGSA